MLAREIPHKGGRTFGFRVSDAAGARRLPLRPRPAHARPGPDGLGALHAAALELAAGVDLLIHDAQYTAAELPARRRSGTRAADYAAALGCRRRRAHRVLLFHHDPSRTDDEVDALAAAVAARHPTVRRRGRRRGHGDRPVSERVFERANQSEDGLRLIGARPLVRLAARRQGCTNERERSERRSRNPRWSARL